MKRALRVGVVTAVVGLLTAILLAESGRWFWVGDLLTSFRMQYLLLLTPAALGAIALRAHVWACVALLCAILNGLHMLPGQLAASTDPAGTGREFRVVSFNVAWWNRDYSEVLRFLAASRADAILLLEVSPEQLQGISTALAALYPHQHLNAGRLPNGALIFSRWPLVRQSSVPLGYRGVVAAHATIDVRGSTIEVNAVHLSWPLAGGSTAARNAELVDLGRLLSRCTTRCIVAGDFNVTQWSDRYAQLLDESGMHPCTADNSPSTWPAAFWAAFRIRIDHCLKSADVGTVAASVGPATGSDHLAIIHDLKMPDDELRTWDGRAPIGRHSQPAAAPAIRATAALAAPMAPFHDVTSGYTCVVVARNTLPASSSCGGRRLR